MIKNKRQSKNLNDFELSNQKKAKIDMESDECDEKVDNVKLEDNKYCSGKTVDDFAINLTCPLKDEDTKMIKETYSREEPLDIFKKDVHCESLLPLKEMGKMQEESSMLTEKTFVIGTQTNTENVCA